MAVEDERLGPGDDEVATVTLGDHGDAPGIPPAVWLELGQRHPALSGGDSGEQILFL